MSLFVWTLILPILPSLWKATYEQTEQQKDRTLGFESDNLRLGQALPLNYVIWTSHLIFLNLKLPYL